MHQMIISEAEVSTFEVTAEARPELSSVGDFAHLDFTVDIADDEISKDSNRLSGCE